MAVSESECLIYDEYMERGKRVKGTEKERERRTRGSDMGRDRDNKTEGRLGRREEKVRERRTYTDVEDEERREKRETRKMDEDETYKRRSYASYPHQRSLHFILAYFPTTAGSSQFCMLCCQPEPIPG